MTLLSLKPAGMLQTPLICTGGKGGEWWRRAAYPAVRSQEVAQVLGFSLVNGGARLAGSRRRRGLAAVVALAVGVGLLAAWGSAGPARAARTAAQVTTVAQASGMLNAVIPQRILDTRTTTGGHHGKLCAGATMTLKVLGAGGTPSAGVSAVMVNVTAGDETSRTRT